MTDVLHFEKTDFYNLITDKDDKIQKIETYFPEYIDARDAIATLLAHHLDELDKEDGIEPDVTYATNYNYNLATGIVDHALIDTLANIHLHTTLFEREHIYEQPSVQETDVLSISVIADFCEAARRLANEKMNSDRLDEKAIENRFSFSDEEKELAREFRIYPETTFRNMSGTLKAKMYNICAVPTINILTQAEDQRQKELLRQRETERLAEEVVAKRKKEVHELDARDDIIQAAKVDENINDGIKRDEIIDAEQMTKELEADAKRNERPAPSRDDMCL